MTAKTTLANPVFPRARRCGKNFPSLSCVARRAALGVLFAASWAWSKDDVARPKLMVPKLETAPTIDGTMAEGEWERAAAVTGFIGATGTFGKVMAPKESRIYLAQDGETLYVAVWTELAPGEKPTMKYRRRDSMVYMDRQQFELWLTPPTEGHVAAYQLIGNAYGALYDLKHVPSLGVKNPGWSPDLEFENSFEVGKHWIAEIAIPFDAVADPDHFAPEKPWGGMVAVAWPQRSWPYTYGWYHNIDTHAKMTMSGDSTCARLLDMSSLFENRFAPALELVNGEDHELTFTIRAERDGTVIEESVTVPAGGIADPDIEGELPEGKGKVNQVNLKVTTEDDTVLVEGDWMYRPLEVDERKTEVVEPEPWTMSTRVSYAPLSKAARCWTDLLDAPMRDRIAKATFRVTDEDGAVVPVTDPRGETAQQAEDTTFDLDSAEVHIWMPEDLKPGTYTITTAFVDADGEVLDSKRDTFEHKDYSEEFVWLDSDKYGEDFTVDPPYEPIELDGRTAKIHGREYTMGGAFPSRMLSRERELLARPINFVAVVDGKPQQAVMTEPFTVVGEPTETRINFAGQYQVAGLTLDLKGELFYDGALLYELDAQPGEQPQTVERLYLSIPVRDAVAQAMWTTRGGAGGGYQNFLSEFPQENGVIWDSDSLGDFTPYLGLCDDDRAIQWFADHDHDWVLGDDVPCSQLIRNPGEIEMRINLVRQPSRGDSLQAEFGLIATPIKPLPSTWRNTVLHYSSMANSKINFFYGPGHGTTGPFKWHDSKGLAEANGIEVPADRSAQAVLDSMSGEGYPDLDAIKEKYGNQEKGHDFVRKGLRCYEDPTLTKHCFFHNASMYFEGNSSKAFRSFFKGEWTIVPTGGWFHLRPVESYQDFFLFHLTQQLKFWAVPGMYYDETYFAPDYNVFNGHGKIMPDGSIRPSLGLMHERRLLYRTRQCMVDQNVPPFIWVHTSGMMAPYAIGAADIAMFGEPNIPTPQQDIMDNISASYMRILGRSQKFGFIPVWMTMAGRGGAQWNLAGRQTFGWCWIHDSVPEVHTHNRGRPLVEYRQQWGIDRDDITFRGYWDETAVTPDNDKFLASYWTRPRDDQPESDTALLQVMNMHYRGEGVSTVEITLDPERLGVGKDFKVYNLESMPAFVRREEFLREADRKSEYGAKDPGVDINGELGRDLVAWKGQAPYDLDELTVVSDGSVTFRIDIPARDFVHLIVR